MLCGARGYQAIAEAFRGFIFKFSCDDVTELGHFSQARRVIISRLNEVIGNTGGRAISIRIKHDSAIPHIPGCHTEHAAELAATKHTEG